MQETSGYIYQVLIGEFPFVANFSDEELTRKVSFLTTDN